MLSTFFLYGGIAVLALRAVLGAIMLAHGWPKIKDIKQAAANFSAMGFHPGALWGTLIALLEFGGGIALLVGFLVQPLAALYAAEFLTAIVWRIFKQHPFVGGWELDALILVGFMTLLFLGGGAYSLDRLFLWSF